jgi:hypothetical protein
VRKKPGSVKLGMLEHGIHFREEEMYAEGNAEWLAKY